MNNVVIRNLTNRRFLLTINDTQVAIEPLATLSLPFLRPKVVFLTYLRFFKSRKIQVNVADDEILYLHIKNYSFKSKQLSKIILLMLPIYLMSIRSKWNVYLLALVAFLLMMDTLFSIFFDDIIETENQTPGN